MASAKPLHIPLIYRLYFLWFEPLAALNGAYMAIFTTNEYLKVITPNWTDISKTPQFQVVVDQVGACYVMFALIEAVVPRVTNELSVWKAVLRSLIFCDIFHIYATGKAPGFDVLMNPSAWRVEDCVNIVMLYVGLFLRAAFIVELGFSKATKSKTV
jgi:hypothetical protein